MVAFSTFSTMTALSAQQRSVATEERLKCKLHCIEKMHMLIMFLSSLLHFLGKELSQISKPCLCHSLQRIFWVPFYFLFTNGICEEERFLLELSLCGITCLLVLWARCSVFCMESWGMERYSYFTVIFYS